MTCSELVSHTPPLRVAASLLVALLCGCQASPPANPSFNDAIQFAFREFETEEPARLAFALRQLEREVYLAVDVSDEDDLDRSLSPAGLTEDDLVGLEHPERDPGLAIPIAVAKLSEFMLSDHQRLPLLADQRPIEPGSPTFYERSFLEGDSCWLESSHNSSSGDSGDELNCHFLRTLNNLTKENVLLTITYVLSKDYRWVDLALPEPAAEVDPEAAVEEPRWAFVARSWTRERAANDEDNRSIEQSYSFEVWLPRNGRGFVRDGSEQNADDGTWSTDSTGGGALRMMSVWAEADIGAELSDAVVAYATRGGIDDIFDAQENWLSENAR